MNRPPVLISTVPTPATSYALDTLLTVKTLLGLLSTTANDDVLSLLIPRVSAAIQAYCNNPFVVEGRQDQFYPGSDGWPWTVKSRTAPLQLARWPVVAISSVVETISGTPTTLAANTDFLIDAEHGQLTRLSTYSNFSAQPYEPTYWRSNPVVVQYTAGYTTLPPDVASAFEIAIKDRFYALTRDSALKSETIPGVYSASYAQPGGSSSVSPFMPEVAGLLSNYRIPVFG